MRRRRKGGSIDGKVELKGRDMEELEPAEGIEEGTDKEGGGQG